MHVIEAIQHIPLLAEVSFQTPDSALDVTLYAAFAVAFVLAIMLYVRDAQRLHPLWTTWLLVLRLAVFAALVVIALNPRDKTRETEWIPSRVAVLVDTSSSMDFREGGGAAVEDPTAPTSKRTRAQAVLDVVDNTPLVDELKRHHEVSVYTFDRGLHNQPVLVAAADTGSGDDSSAEAASAAKTGRSESSLKKAPSKEPSSKSKKTSADPWAKLRKPQGQETRLGAALLELMRLQKGRSLSAIVVISDGQHNSGIHPEAANVFARNNNIRLYTVGVGSTVRPVNVRVASIDAPNEVNRDAPFDVTVYVQGERVGGKQVQVNLKYKPQGAPDTEYKDAPLQTDETEPDSDVVTLPNTNRSVPKVFHLQPQSPGKYEYVVELNPLFRVDEFRTDDNRKEHRLNVIERNLGVLLIAGGPMRDYRFVRNMLFRHKNIDVDVWLQTVDDRFLGNVSQDADDVLTGFPESFPMRPKALAEGYVDDPETQHALQYDVIIAFDPNWDSPQLGADGLQKLDRWLSSQAGGLILVAGDVNTPLLAAAPQDDPQYETIRSFYPVALSRIFALDADTKSEKPWPFKLEDAARGVSFLKLAEEEGGQPPDDDDGGDGSAPYPWNEFEGFYRCYPSDGKKAGAVVYSFFTDPALEAIYESKPILFAAHDYGVGRVLYFGTSETWRLRDVDVDYYDRFWVKSVFEVAKRRLGRKSPFGNILLRKDEYFVGDNVAVEANLLDLDNQPLDVESVRMEIIRPDGRPVDPVPKLVRDENRPGFYVGSFTVRQQGSYQLRVDNPKVEARGRIATVVPVKFPQTESLNPIQNASLLDELTEQTGGRYFTIADFRSVFSRIGEARRKVTELQQTNAATDDEVGPAEEELQSARGVLVGLFPDRGFELEVRQQVRTLWDMRWVIFALVAALSAEWLTRKLLKLA